MRRFLIILIVGALGFPLITRYTGLYSPLWLVTYYIAYMVLLARASVSTDARKLSESIVDGKMPMDAPTIVSQPREQLWGIAGAAISGFCMYQAAGGEGLPRVGLTTLWLCLQLVVLSAGLEHLNRVVILTRRKNVESLEKWQFREEALGSLYINQGAISLMYGAAIYPTLVSISGGGFSVWWLYCTVYLLCTVWAQRETIRSFIKFTPDLIEGKEQIKHLTVYTPLVTLVVMFASSLLLGFDFDNRSLWPEGIIVAALVINAYFLRRELKIQQGRQTTKE